jgi:hypothetical protein
MNGSIEVVNDTLLPPSLPPLLPPLPCSATFNPLACASEGLDAERSFLVIVILALACAVCALCVLVGILAVLVSKLSNIWLKALARPATTEPSDDPRNGLLQETKSSFATTSSKAEGKKKKKTSFAADTSCAAARDVDEEDL